MGFTQPAVLRIARVRKADGKWPQNPFAEEEKMRDHFTGHATFGTKSQPVCLLLPRTGPVAIGDNHIHANNITKAPGLGCLRNVGKCCPGGLREIHCRRYTGMLQRGDHRFAGRNINAKRFFEKDRFAGRSRHERQVTSGNRRAGKVDQRGRIDRSISTAGNDGLRAQLLCSLTGIRVRVP